MSLLKMITTSEKATQKSEWRGGRWLRHLLLALVHQRVYQIACGYEDQNGSS